MRKVDIDKRDVGCERTFLNMDPPTMERERHKKHVIFYPINKFFFIKGLSKRPKI